MLSETTIRNFKGRFNGRLILPDDSEYESARRVHNGAIDRRPALVARCATAEGVCQAVEFARENQLIVAVRSGGHSQIGHSVCEGGMVIDLSDMKQAVIDTGRGVARAQTGLLAGELDRIAQQSGLATPVGQCPSVGIGGLTTGGGFGWLAGKYGLTCDNVTSAEVVSAEGRKLTAGAHCNEDLLWALRGGGGNFGIAIEFEYRLHRITSVVGGMLCYLPSQARTGFAFMREFLSRAPDELAASFGIRAVGDGSAFAIAVCFSGDPRDAERLLRPLRSFATPISGSIGSLSYLQMQSLMGESPPGSRLYNRGAFIRVLSDAAIDAIVEASASNPSTAKLLFLDHYHGAMSRVPQDATAFSVREPGFGLLIQSSWDTPAEARRQTAWVDETITSLGAFASDIVYSASLGDEGPDRVRRCYGPNYPRLAELKRKYDPENFFRLNQNILPDSSRQTR